jgi:hypothetical protein
VNPITPERIAEHLYGGEMRIGRSFAGYVDVSAEGAVARIKFTPVKDWPELGDARHYRAVVVEGETAPDLAEVEQIKARLEAAEAVMWQALAQPKLEAASHLLALYLGAVDAAQAEQDGGE